MFATMTTSPALQARRALVKKLILTLAALYRAVLVVNRDSCDSDVNKALKKLLLKVDLRDAVAKRPVLGKTAYRARVRRLCQTKKAQKVAGNHARALKGVCRIILRKKGAHSGK